MFLFFKKKKTNTTPRTPDTATTDTTTTDTTTTDTKTTSQPTDGSQNEHYIWDKQKIHLPPSYNKNKEAPIIKIKKGIPLNETPYEQKYYLLDGETLKNRKLGGKRKSIKNISNRNKRKTKKVNHIRKRL
jgi:hypothetical protein